MSDPKQTPQEKAAETREGLRHKGPNQEAADPRTGAKVPENAPDGNGATGKPAAFPPHN